MADRVAPTERVFVENEFGTITNKRVIYYRSKGWLTGGSREDIPLQHVTSVRLDISRSLVYGLLSVLFGLVLFGRGGGATIIGLFLLALAALLLWGSPNVVVNTAGRDLSASKGFPWQRASANAFVEALREQLFNKAA